MRKTVVLPLLVLLITPWIAEAASAMAASVALASTATTASPPVVWGGLLPGPHAVGFRVLFETDPARAYFPDLGVPKRSLGRPLQLTIWYPARPESGLPTRSGDFVDLAAAELGEGRSDEADSVAAEFRNGPMRPFFDGPPSDEAWKRVLRIPFASRRGAEASEGRFPLVLHTGGGALTQGVLFEYLASHGYVVVSVPLLGPSAAWHGRGEWSVRSIEDMAADLGHAARVAIELPFVDPERIAIIGAFAGAQGVLFAMRSRAISALAALESTWMTQVEQSPHFDLAALHAPILDVPSAELRGTSEARDRLRYAERTVVRVRDSTHLDSYQFHRLALAARDADRPDEARREISVAHRQYEVTAELTRTFLERHLAGDARAWEALVAKIESDKTIAIEHDSALPPVPTEADLLALVRRGEINTAAKLVAEAGEREPGIVLFGEDAMSTTARFLLRDRGPVRAVEAFRLIAQVHPSSPRAHETFGDALARIDHYHEAREAWTRALERTPADDVERRARLEAKLARGES